MNNIDEFKATIKDFTAEQFVQNLPDICSEMHTDLGVISFGIIIYDETTPEFRKMLSDKDYWEALDKASGDRMVVFSLPDRIQRKKTKTKASKKPIIKTRPELMVLANVDFGSFPQDLDERYSYLIKQLFSCEAPLEYPSVLFFQVAGTKIYNYLIVSLNEDDLRKSFKAVQELFICISEVLNYVAKENYGNQKEIFNLVKDKLITRKYTLLALSGAKIVTSFAGLLKTIF